MTRPEKPSTLLSVITVVFNNAEDIERTILSIIRQSFYRNIEYIVVDGASTDGTLAIIHRYADKIDRIISEKDSGIYDAMNKGLSLAKGEYVLFMNSGDELFANDTVEKVFGTSPHADIYYGETEMIDQQGRSLGQRRHHAPKSFTWKSFKYGMNISHQAIYIRKRITEPYDPAYRLSADIDWIIRSAKKAKTIVNTNQYVAKYLVGGISKKRHWKSLKERYKIFNHYYGIIPNFFNHLAIAFNLCLYYVKHRRTND